jgi:hypothetical protein
VVAHRGQGLAEQAGEVGLPAGEDRRGQDVDGLAAFAVVEVHGGEQGGRRGLPAGERPAQQRDQPLVVLLEVGAGGRAQPPGLVAERFSQGGPTDS